MVRRIRQGLGQGPTCELLLMEAATAVADADVYIFEVGNKDTIRGEKAVGLEQTVNEAYVTLL